MASQSLLRVRSFWNSMTAGRSRCIPSHRYDTVSPKSKRYCPPNFTAHSSATSYSTLYGGDPAAPDVGNSPKKVMYCPLGSQSSSGEGGPTPPVQPGPDPGSAP